MGDQVPGFGGRKVEGLIRIAAIGRDDAIDLDVDVVHEGDEGIEALRDGQAAAERSNVGELVEDEENEGVRYPIEMVFVGEEWVSIDSGFGLHFFSLSLSLSLLSSKR